MIPVKYPGSAKLVGTVVVVVVVVVVVPYRSNLSSWLEIDVRLQIPSSVPSSEFILNAHTALKNC